MNREEAFEAIVRLRERIDEIDRELVRMLNERTRVVERLGRIKDDLEMPVYEPKREDQVYRNIFETNQGPLSPEALKRLFERIIDEMRTLQAIDRKNRAAGSCEAAPARDED